MVTKKEAETLKERAENFLLNAKELFKKKIFDLSAFNTEQFCQLYLKYKLLLLVGDFPKTHSLRHLLQQTLKIRKSKEIKKFVEENISVLGNLESAYITSRYLPRKFDASEVKEMLQFATKFKKIVDKL